MNADTFGNAENYGEENGLPIDEDDVKLTALALGEIDDPAEVERLQRLLESNESKRKDFQVTEQLASLIRDSVESNLPLAPGSLHDRVLAELDNCSHTGLQEDETNSNGSDLDNEAGSQMVAKAPSNASSMSSEFAFSRQRFIAFVACACLLVVCTLAIWRPWEDRSGEPTNMAKVEVEEQNLDRSELAGESGEGLSSSSAYHEKDLDAGSRFTDSVDQVELKQRVLEQNKEALKLESASSDFSVQKEALGLDREGSRLPADKFGDGGDAGFGRGSGGGGKDAGLKRKAMESESRKIQSDNSFQLGGNALSPKKESAGKPQDEPGNSAAGGAGGGDSPAPEPAENSDAARDYKKETKRYYSGQARGSNTSKAESDSSKAESSAEGRGRAGSESSGIRANGSKEGDTRGGRSGGLSKEGTARQQGNRSSQNTESFEFAPGSSDSGQQAGARSGKDSDARKGNGSGTAPASREAKSDESQKTERPKSGSAAFGGKVENAPKPDVPKPDLPEAEGKSSQDGEAQGRAGVQSKPQKSTGEKSAGEESAQGQTQAFGEADRSETESVKRRKTELDKKKQAEDRFKQSTPESKPMPQSENELEESLKERLQGKRSASDGKESNSSREKNFDKKDSNNEKKPTELAESEAQELGGDQNSGGVQDSESDEELDRADDNADSSKMNLLTEDADAKNKTSELKPSFENEFVRPIGTDALSTFSVDTDTASYTNVRQMLNRGQRPHPDQIRIEEFINYFEYEYPNPKSTDRFSVSMEVAASPWTPGNQLLRVGLKAEDLSSAQRPPSNLVFLIDISGSMRNANKLPLLQKGLKAMTDVLREDDYVSIVTYSSAIQVPLQPTDGSQKDKIKKVISSLRAQGSTNGSGGLQEAYKQAQKHFLKEGTNRIIMGTDGDFNVGIQDDNELVDFIKEKAKSGVFLTICGFGTNNFQDQKVQKMAQNGNGKVLYVDSEAESNRVFVEKIAGSLVTVAKDVKLQLLFNPKTVQAYRLIGYETRLLANADFDNDQVDAGEIDAGDNVTALYEIVPADSDFTLTSTDSKTDEIDLKYQVVTERKLKLTEVADSQDIAALRIRYKKPTADKSDLLEFTIQKSDNSFNRASKDLQLAATAAGFGMLLRNSQYRGTLNFEGLKELAQGAINGRDRQVEKSDDSNPEADVEEKPKEERATKNVSPEQLRRKELVDLIERAKGIYNRK